MRWCEVVGYDVCLKIYSLFSLRCIHMQAQRHWHINHSEMIPVPIPHLNPHPIQVLFQVQRLAEVSDRWSLNSPGGGGGGLWQMPPAQPVDGTTLARVELEWIRGGEACVSTHLSVKQPQTRQNTSTHRGDGWPVIIILPTQYISLCLSHLLFSILKNLKNSKYSSLGRYL